MDQVLKLRDGAKTPISIMGTGRPIVFVHGWGVQGGLFKDAAARLSSDFQTITFDLRGHGGFKVSGAAPTIEQLAGDLKDMSGALDLQDALVVGWSMGAMVAWEALADEAFAARVAGLVTLDMSPRITNDATWSLGLSDGRSAHTTLQAVEAMRADWPGMAEKFVPRIFAEDNETRCASLIASIVEDTKKQDPEALAGLWQSMSVQDFRKALPGLHTPILAIHGAKSKLYTLATGEYVASTAANAALSVFSESGHAPHLEEPDLFQTEITRFAAILSGESVTRLNKTVHL